jgi:hypothetical protein
MTVHYSDSDKKQLNKIKIELGNHTYNTIKAFDKIFPVEGLVLYTLILIDLEDNSAYNYNFNNINKFWSDWHKFKKLKAFL